VGCFLPLKGTLTAPSSLEDFRRRCGFDGGDKVDMKTIWCKKKALTVWAKRSSQVSKKTTKQGG